ncbi:MAG: hypothetical protein GY751_15490 [Bacteroidetes bacterium]|nr:hypothetical protein [Bacteroidota bacterium]
MRLATLIILILFSVQTHAEHLKGYSVAHVFHPFPGHKINAEAIRLFDALEPDVLRFPGGTVANKYHYYKPGYGFSKSDMKRQLNYIHDFVRLVNDLESKPKVVFVMNLFEHYTGADEAELIQENMDAFQFLLDKGMNVTAVELGNEFYLYPEIKSGSSKVTVNPELNNEIESPGTVEEKKENFLMRWLRILTGKFTGKDNQDTPPKAISENPNFVYYEQLCRKYKTRIHAISPDMRLGIPLGNLNNKKHTEYNDYMLRHFEFIDAYVCHFYGSFNKNCARTDEACIRKGLDWYMSKQLETRLKRVQETGKETWVTEWNALKFGHYGDEGSWIRNSEIHKEYTRKFIEMYDRYGVTISNFHKLAGPMTGAAYNAIDVDAGKCYTTPIYDVLLEQYR